MSFSIGSEIYLSFPFFFFGKLCLPFFLRLGYCPCITPNYAPEFLSYSKLPCKLKFWLIFVDYLLTIVMEDFGLSDLYSHHIDVRC